jgi:hypothetical protein
MLTLSRFAAIGLIALMSLAGPGAVRPSARAAATDPVLKDFQSRLEQYMRLHEERHAAVARADSSRGVAANRASTDQLAARIRAARAGARQGDIFTHSIAATLRSVLNAEVRGASAAHTRATIRDDAPAKFMLHVNAAYPAGASFPTVPSNVLAALPQLPPGLEYRIVDRHLILRDVDANIIVDYLFDVMCAIC